MLPGDDLIESIVQAARKYLAGEMTESASYFERDVMIDRAQKSLSRADLQKWDKRYRAAMGALNALSATRAERGKELHIAMADANLTVVDMKLAHAGDFGRAVASTGFHHVKTSYAHKLGSMLHKQIDTIYCNPDILEAGAKAGMVKFVETQARLDLGLPLNALHSFLLDLQKAFDKQNEWGERLRGMFTANPPVVYLPRFDWRALLAEHGDVYSDDPDIPPQGLFFEFRLAEAHLGVSIVPTEDGKILRSVMRWIGTKYRPGWLVFYTDLTDKVGAHVTVAEPESNFHDCAIPYMNEVFDFVAAEFEILNSVDFIEVVEEQQPLPVSKKEARAFRGAGKPLPSITYKTVRLKASPERERGLTGESTGNTVRYHWRRTHWWPRDPHDTRRHKRKGRFVGDITKGEIIKRYAIPVEPEQPKRPKGLPDA